jgi:hypothetical protein
VAIDFDKKEASFTLKPDTKFDLEAAKTAVKATNRGRVGEVKAAPK